MIQLYLLIGAFPKAQGDKLEEYITADFYYSFNIITMAFDVCQN